MCVCVLLLFECVCVCVRERGVGGGGGGRVSEREREREREEAFTVPFLFVANLLLQDTVERIHVGKQFGDIPRGIYLVRGENVALCGEIVSSLRQLYATSHVHYCRCITDFVHNVTVL